VVGNLRWSWDHDTISLFRLMDEDLWEETGHNPLMMLGQLKQQRFEELVVDDSFMSQLQRVGQRFDEYMSSVQWYEREHEVNDDGPVVAYFSFEFGVTESLQIYTGGLGILAGDHLKSASDLGVPW